MKKQMIAGHFIPMIQQQKMTKDILSTGRGTSKYQARLLIILISLWLLLEVQPRIEI